MPTMRDTSRRILAAICTAGLALGAAGCASGHDRAPSSGEFTFVAPGGQTTIKYPADQRKAVHPFSGPSVADQHKTIALDDYKGKVVVLNAWGQWCAPCRSESDDMQQIQAELSKMPGKPGTVLGINVRDYNQQVSKDFMVDNGLKYPSLYDPPFKTAAALGGVPASVIPTTIILDKQHRPAAVFLREVTAKDVMDVVNPLLAEEG